MSRGFVIGLLLTLTGAAIILYNGAIAFSHLASLYQGALTHPLDQPVGGEEKASKSMTHAAANGAIGIPFVIVGAIMTRVARRRRRRASGQ